MSYPLAIPRELEDVLTRSTSEQLVHARTRIILKAEAGQIEPEAAAAICGIIEYELQLRQVEPLWRKASRFARRNKEGLGIAASFLAVAVGLDVAID